MDGRERHGTTADPALECPGLSVRSWQQGGDEIREKIPEQPASCAPRWEMGTARSARNLLNWEFRLADSVPVSLYDHFEVDGYSSFRKRHVRKGVPRHAPKAVQDVPNPGATAPAKDIGRPPEGQDKPFTVTDEVSVLLVGAAADTATADHMPEALFEQRRESGEMVGRDGAFGVKKNQRIATKNFESMAICAIIGGVFLSQHGDALLLHVLHSAIGTAIIDGQHLAEGTCIDTRQIFAATVNFIPRQ